MKLTSLALVFALLLGLNYWQYTESQSLMVRAVSAEQASADSRAVITTLKAQAQQRQKLQRQLAEKQQRLAQSLNQKNQTIRRLERENENYRNWASTRLPDAAQRLRQRPTITGADHYQQYLSSSHALHPASNSAKPERRPDD